MNARLSRVFCVAIPALLALSVNASAQSDAGKEKPATPPAAAPTSPAAPAAPATETPAQEKLVYVKMTTSKGDIVLELNETKAPISVANFLSYVDKGYYNGTIFHRVIPTFMIQGGGFGPDMTEKATDKPIKNEWKNGLKNVRGSVAMARTQVADSATSQFFINVKDNDFLDQPRDGAAYAVFGKVVEGMDVVDAIKGVATTSKSMHKDVPVEPVTIVTVAKLSDYKPK